MRSGVAWNAVKAWQWWQSGSCPKKHTYQCLSVPISLWQAQPLRLVKSNFLVAGCSRLQAMALSTPTPDINVEVCQSLHVTEPKKIATKNHLQLLPLPSAGAVSVLVRVIDMTNRTWFKPTKLWQTAHDFPCWFNLPPCGMAKHEAQLPSPGASMHLPPQELTASGLADIVKTQILLKVWHPLFKIFKTNMLHYNFAIKLNTMHVLTSAEFKLHRSTCFQPGTVPGRWPLKSQRWKMKDVSKQPDATPIAEKNIL